MAGAVQSQHEIELQQRAPPQPQPPKQPIKLGEPSLPTFGQPTDRSGQSESSVGLLGPLNISQESLIRAPRKSVGNLRSVQPPGPTKHLSHPSLSLSPEPRKKQQRVTKEEIALSAPKLPEMYIRQTNVTAVEEGPKNFMMLSPVEAAALKAATTAAKQN